MIFFNVNSKIGTLHLIGCDQVGVVGTVGQKGKQKLKIRKTIKKRKWRD